MAFESLWLTLESKAIKIKVEHWLLAQDKATEGTIWSLMEAEPRHWRIICSSEPYVIGIATAINGNLPGHW